MSRKLLLADDSITIQKVIGITFANEDYQLTVVDNGDAALEKARAERPDLILADVFMPGKNGYELAAAIKQDPALRDVPVLLLAGTFEPFDEEKAVSSGADSWIAKPFESQALISKVEQLLSSTASQPAPAQPAPAQPAPAQPAPAQPAPAQPAPAQPAPAQPAPAQPAPAQPAPAQPAPAQPAPAQPAPAQPAPAQPAPVDDPWSDVDVVMGEAPQAPESPIFEDESDFIVDDGSESDTTEEIQDVWADTASIPLQEEDVMEVEPFIEPVSPDPAPAPPASAPSQSASAPATAAGVESQVAAMSEEDLEKLIERVAGAVLEKIAWEVVPDLAENLIKDEIRKIRENA